MKMVGFADLLEPELRVYSGYLFLTVKQSQKLGEFGDQLSEVKASREASREASFFELSKGGLASSLARNLLLDKKFRA